MTLAQERPAGAPPAAGRARRLALPGLSAAALVAWAGALRLRDPHVAGSWGTCPFLLLTGQPCPACGGLRAVNDLTHGDVVAAASSNLAVVVAIPLAVAWWLVWVRRAAAGGPAPAPSVRAVWVVTAAVAVFAVVRWLPFAAWLAP